MAFGMLAVLFGVFSVNGCVSRPAAETAADANRRLGRGINLGNMLEAPAEGAWGISAQPEYLQLIRAAGFDSVRIPVRWSAHAREQPPYTIDSAFFARVDEVVGWALAQNLAVVINVHHYEALMDDPAGQRDRFLSIWRQVAGHYAAQPAAVFFELLNEPRRPLDVATWNQLLAEALAVVRESNPLRMVIVGPTEWNSFRKLDGLRLPADDRRLIVAFHYYEPFPFTHQDASWINNSAAWRGTRWTGGPDELAEIERVFDQVAAWGRAHARSIYLGEFGAYNRAALDDRARWTECVARAAERHGFSWAYWEFCSGFGAYDPQAGAWRPELKAALIP